MRAVPFVFVVVYALLANGPVEAGPASKTGRGSEAGSAPAALRHVRPRDPAAAMLFRFGIDRSARFREIVGTLEQSNVIVYVEVRQEAEHPVSGGLTFIGEAEGIRWVRAVVDSGTSSYISTCQDIVRLTSILGHELQHALEASEAASLSDVYEFEQYFRSIGVDEGPELLDTHAARQAGRLVADELRGMAPQRPRLRGNVQQLVDVAPGDLLERLR
jgi:hypothetical protein